MEVVIFAPSAFHHGYDVEDFYDLVANRPLKIRSQRGLNGVYELLGRNLAGDYLHIVYRVFVNGQLRVFHMNRMTDAQRRRHRNIRR